MKKFYAALLYALFLISAQKARCADTAYLELRYGGDIINKPYHEIVFYLPGAFDTIEWNFFRHYIKVNEKQFKQLVNIFIHYPDVNETLDKAQKLLYSPYYAIMIEKHKSHATANIKVQELLQIRDQSIRVFDNSPDEKELKDIWGFIFQRLGVKLE